MRVARVRWLISSLIFVVWLGYLAYLALNYRHPMVISRSQLTRATHFVKAELKLNEIGELDTTILIQKSFGKLPLPEGKPITIENASLARLSGGGAIGSSGSYFVPLEYDGFTYRIASSGLPSEKAATDLPIVYPWSPEVEGQIHRLDLDN